MFYLFIFRERGREGEREGEKQQCVVASHTPSTGELACNPDVCPDGELNGRPFGSQAGTQSTEPHQPGQEVFIIEHPISQLQRYIRPGCSPSMWILKKSPAKVILMEY